MDEEVEHQEQSYHGNGNHKWETVVRPLEGHSMTRLRVPGGWLYRDSGTGHLVYVPLPPIVKHKVLTSGTSAPGMRRSA